MHAAVTGTFDGVHRGHQFLLRTLKTEARRRGLDPLVVTFSTHPLSSLSPHKAPALLTQNQNKEALLRHEGVEVAMLRFNDICKLTAEEFLAMLREKFDVRLFLLGFNNRIGSDRIGLDSPGLAVASARSGVEILPASEHPEGDISSTAIRRALAQGQIDRANAMLGRPYAITGIVVPGRQLGRTLNFPTANVAPPANVAIPLQGVYVGLCAGHRCVINVGRRPTVEGRADAPLSIEAHILDYDGDLYGCKLTLEFLHRLRGEKRFESIDDLKCAIAADVEQARSYESDF